MMRATLTKKVLIAGVFILSNAHGQVLDASSSQSLILDGTLSDSSGRIAVNISAGSSNAQANIAAISIGKDVAIAKIRSQQDAQGSYQENQGLQKSEIGANAFRNASGLIAVNQSSGTGNTQANLVAIAQGKIAEVSIEQLGQMTSQTTSSVNASQNSNKYRQSTSTIADSAFIGASGIVQVNQLSGVGNNTSNLFTMRLGTP